MRGEFPAILQILEVPDISPNVPVGGGAEGSRVWLLFLLHCLKRLCRLP